MVEPDRDIAALLRENAMDRALLREALERPGRLSSGISAWCFFIHGTWA